MVPFTTLMLVPQAWPPDPAAKIGCAPKAAAALVQGGCSSEGFLPEPSEYRGCLLTATQCFCTPTASAHRLPKIIAWSFRKHASLISCERCASAQPAKTCWLSLETEMPLDNCHALTGASCMPLPLPTLTSFCLERSPETLCQVQSGQTRKRPAQMPHQQASWQ